MPKLIFATVGTSAIENCLKNYPRNKQKKLTLPESVAYQLELCPEEEHAILLDSAPQSNLADNSIVYNLQNNIKTFEKYIHKSNMATFTPTVSAEVASLLVASKEDYMGEFEEGDEIWLIPSGTPVGIVCAEANRIVLQERFKNATIGCTDPLEGVVFSPKPGEEKEAQDKFLSTGVDMFESVIKFKKEAFKKQNGKNFNSYLDITGGFKGLIPFAPFLCLRHVDSLLYFYQEAAKPIVLNDDYFLMRFRDKNKSLAPEQHEMQPKTFPSPGD